MTIKVGCFSLPAPPPPKPQPTRSQHWFPSLAPPLVPTIGSLHWHRHWFPPLVPTIGALSVPARSNAPCVRSVSCEHRQNPKSRRDTEKSFACSNLVEINMQLGGRPRDPAPPTPPPPLKGSHRRSTPPGASLVLLPHGLKEVLAVSGRLAAKLASHLQTQICCYKNKRPRNQKQTHLISRMRYSYFQSCERTPPWSPATSPSFHSPLVN